MELQTPYDLVGALAGGLRDAISRSDHTAARQIASTLAHHVQEALAGLDPQGTQAPDVLLVNGHLSLERLDDLLNPTQPSLVNSLQTPYDLIGALAGGLRDAISRSDHTAARQIASTLAHHVQEALAGLDPQGTQAPDVLLVNGHLSLERLDDLLNPTPKPPIDQIRAAALRQPAPNDRGGGIARPPLQHTPEVLNY